MAENNESYVHAYFNDGSFLVQEQESLKAAYIELVPEVGHLTTAGVFCICKG